MKNDIVQFNNDTLPLEVAKGYQYYLKGLTAIEIGKLIDVSPRTVQRWAKEYGFKAKANPLTVQEKAMNLLHRGFTYKQIAKAIGKSKTTVYYYIKEAREKEKT